MTGSRRYPWSARTAWDLTETPWARQLARLRAEGAPLCDLTASNPTRCGFTYDATSILAPLHDPGALYYDPDPRVCARRGKLSAAITETTARW